MPYAVFTSVLVPGSADVVLLGRVRSRGGELLTQATVASIAWTLSDVSDGAAQGVLATGAFVVADTIFDQLQVDALWTKDSVGYCFKGVIAAASLPLANSGHRMQADVKITMASGEVLRGSYNWPSAKVWG